MFGLGIQELIIVGIVAVILFGKRLPEVAPFGRFELPRVPPRPERHPIADGRDRDDLQHPYPVVTTAARRDRR